MEIQTFEIYSDEEYSDDDDFFKPQQPRLAFSPKKRDLPQMLLDEQNEKQFLPNNFFDQKTLNLSNEISSNLIPLTPMKLGNPLEIHFGTPKTLENSNSKKIENNEDLKELAVHLIEPNISEEAEINKNLNLELVDEIVNKNLEEINHPNIVENSEKIEEVQKVICPFCWKRLNDKLNGMKHVKICGKDLPTERILEALQLHERQMKEWDSLGIRFPGLQTQVKKKSNPRRKKAIQYEEEDEDLDFAHAISASIQEEISKRSGKASISKNIKTNVLQKDAEKNSAEKKVEERGVVKELAPVFNMADKEKPSSFRVRFQKESKPKLTKNPPLNLLTSFMSSKKKRGKIDLTKTKLYTLSDEERQSLIAEKISEIIGVNEADKENESHKFTEIEGRFEESQNLLPLINKNSPLWKLSSLLEDTNEDSFKCPSISKIIESAKKRSLSISIGVLETKHSLSPTMLTPSENLSTQNFSDNIQRQDDNAVISETQKNIEILAIESQKPTQNSQPYFTHKSSSETSLNFANSHKKSIKNVAKAPSFEESISEASKVEKSKPESGVISLANDLLRLFAKKNDYDLTIYGREEIPLRAHKLILKARCPLLINEIIQDGGSFLKNYKNKSEVIALTSFSHSAVKYFIKYLYSGIIHFKEEEKTDFNLSEEIVKLGEIYKVKIDFSPFASQQSRFNVVGEENKKKDTVSISTQTQDNEGIESNMQTEFSLEYNKEVEEVNKIESLEIFSKKKFSQHLPILSSTPISFQKNNKFISSEGSWKISPVKMNEFDKSEIICESESEINYTFDKDVNKKGKNENGELTAHMTLEESEDDDIFANVKPLNADVLAKKTSKKSDNCSINKSSLNRLMCKKRSRSISSLYEISDLSAANLNRSRKSKRFKESESICKESFLNNVENNRFNFSSMIDTNDEKSLSTLKAPQSPSIMIIDSIVERSLENKGIRAVSETTPSNSSRYYSSPASFEKHRNRKSCRKSLYSQPIDHSSLKSKVSVNLNFSEISLLNISAPVSSPLKKINPEKSTIHLRNSESKELNQDTLKTNDDESNAVILDFINTCDQKVANNSQKNTQKSRRKKNEKVKSVVQKSLVSNNNTKRISNDWGEEDESIFAKISENVELEVEEEIVEEILPKRGRGRKKGSDELSAPKKAPGAKTAKKAKIILPKKRAASLTREAESPRRPDPVQTTPILTNNQQITNCTPLLNYSLIDTPILKAELKKYGLKPFPRTKAKKILRHIYKETH